MKLVYSEKTAWYDWRDADSYPRDENSSANRWAWEFLRRNPLYIRDWNYFITTLIVGKWGHLPSASELESSHFQAAYLEWTMMIPFEEECHTTKYTPSIEDGEDRELWKAHCENYEKNLPLHQLLGRRWNLLRIIDPASTIGYYHFGTQPPISYKTMKDGHCLSFGNRDRFELKSSHVLCHMNVSFDLSIPLEGQFEFLKETLERERQLMISLKKMPKDGDIRIQRRLLSTYLRLLDAKVYGVTNKEIGMRLYPNHADDLSNNYRRTKMVKAQLTAAEKLRDSGFFHFIGNIIKVNLEK